MGIKVDPNKAVKFTVSYVDAGAKPSWVDAGFSVDYVNVGFKTSWIDVAVFAEVSFPDVLAVDVVTPTDLITLSTGKSFIDSVVSTEQKAYLIEKNLNDTLVLSDEFIRTLYDLDDSFGVLDLQAIVSTMQKADNITIASSGLVVIQDYSDITYFLEDYVGTATTFT